jgi:hypothetical protein
MIAKLLHNDYKTIAEHLESDCLARFQSDCATIGTRLRSDRTAIDKLSRNDHKSIAKRSRDNFEAIAAKRSANKCKVIAR